MNKVKIQKQTLMSPTTVSSPITVQSPISKFMTTSEESTKDEAKRVDKKHSGTSTSKDKLKDKDKNYLPKKEEEAKPKEKKHYTNEPIRNTVEKYLFESLFKRTTESIDDSFPKLSKEDLERFCRKTEEELYRLFKKDTGQKYKAKYRSLIFNIKDLKNEQLFRKICTKEVGPYRFVRMTAEELASQELSEWRQNENKHQLDMIKKNELDLLTQPKNYVLKSHKGEEVMEDKEIDRINVGLPTSVEDVVAVLNNSLKSEDDQQVVTHGHTEYSHHHQVHSTQSTSHEKHEKIFKDRERDKDKERTRRSNHQKEKHKRRSQSRSRDRDHERLQTKSPKKEKISITKHHLENPEKKGVAKEEHKKLEPTTIKPIPKKREAVDPTHEYNLIDKILESTKTIEEAANLVNKEKPVAIVQPRSLHKSENFESLTKDHTSDLVDRRKFEKPYYKYYADETFNLWDGGINMNEVSSFQLYFQAISKCESLDETFTELELTVVGRIKPDTVWDYLGKIKRSPNKILDVLKLIPGSESEVIGYIELFTYLKNLNRLGVIKPRSKAIKDFYIIPLGKDDSLPLVLQNYKDLDLFTDPTRPDLILGVVIRFGENMKPVVKEQMSRTTRPNSDKELDKIIKDPFLNKSKSLFPAPPPPPPPLSESSPDPTEDDGNEPYSPGRAFDDEVDTSVGKSVDNLTLDEVNRQIEERKKELQQIAASALGTGISIPHNLSQILASIPKVPTPLHTSTQPLDDEYDPELVQRQFSSRTLNNIEDLPLFSDDDDGGPSTKKPKLN